MLPAPEGVWGMPPDMLKTGPGTEADLPAARVLRLHLRSGRGDVLWQLAPDGPSGLSTRTWHQHGGRRMSLEAGEQDSSIIASGVFRNRTAGPLCSASSEAPHKRSLISFLPLAGTLRKPYHPVEPFCGSKRGAGRLLLEKMVKIIKTASCHPAHYLPIMVRCKKFPSV